MRQKLDLKGQKYGRITLIKFAYTKKKRTFWHGICECGTKAIIGVSELRTGNTKSCGCLRKEIDKIAKHWLPEGEASFNHLYANYRKRAKKSNFNFTLTKEEFKLLTSSNCNYCGIIPSQKFGFERLNGYYIYNGIDRKDSKIGYTTENSVACCKICNFMKHILEEEEFFEHIKKIVIYNNLI